MKLTIRTDGSCDPPARGYMGIGIVITEGTKTIKRITEDLEWGTNNIAEYKAVIRALQEAKILGANEVRLFTDSALVCGQLVGGWKINKSHLQDLNTEARKLINSFDTVEICQINREDNSGADRLSKGRRFEEEDDFDPDKVEIVSRGGISRIEPQRTEEIRDLEVFIPEPPKVSPDIREVVLSTIIASKSVGVTFEDLVSKSALPVNDVEDAIKELISEGDIFEPKSGRFKRLL